MKNDVEAKLNAIVSKYMKGASYPKNISFFAPSINFEPYEMAQLLMEIEKEFAVDLDMFIKKLSKFSFDEIVQELQM
jgi:hypothetical protein